VTILKKERKKTQASKSAAKPKVVAPFTKLDTKVNQV
jgi:hypothetical protein